jgi:hypothetical protein
MSQFDLVKNENVQLFGGKNDFRSTVSNGNGKGKFFNPDKLRAV